MKLGFDYSIAITFKNRALRSGVPLFNILLLLLLFLFWFACPI